jgi:hypothetical protein
MNVFKVVYKYDIGIDFFWHSYLRYINIGIILVSYIFIFGFILFIQIQNGIKIVCNALHTNSKWSYQRKNMSCTQQTQLYLMKLEHSKLQHDDS